MGKLANLRVSLARIAPQLLFSVLLLTLSSGAAAQSLEPTDYEAVEAAPKKQRLIGVVPRVGAQLGTWGGDLQTTIEDSGLRLHGSDDASSGPGFVGGVEAFFRIGRRFRLGAGLLAMPALKLRVDPKDDVLSDSARPSYNMKLGTLLRVPVVIEWKLPIADDVSIVAGVLPFLEFLIPSQQVKNLQHRVCEGKCSGPNIGVGVDGEVGAMYDLGAVALRTDLRFGLEVLNIVSDDTNNVSVDMSLVGVRMLLLAGVEI